MNDASQPGQDAAPVPEGARPVHPDGDVDAPLDAQAAGQYGGTTGAEHDGGAAQVAAESQDADDALDGRSPHGAGEPVQGGTDRVAGAGSPAEGARGGSPVEEKSSPAQGLGGSSSAAGSPVQEAESPSQGLGPATGAGSPVQDAASPEHGTGSDDQGGDRPEQADPLG